MSNTKIKEGMKAPEFTSIDANNGKISLSDYKGKWIVLYFYPADDTPGCTIEAMGFTKLAKEFNKLNATILGVSPDNCSSHQKFIDKYSLKVELLSDEGKEVQKLYGVWGKKKFMGREYTGTIRSTFLINPSGKIAKAWHNVRAKGHAEEVLDELKKKSQ